MIESATGQYQDTAKHAFQFGDYHVQFQSLAGSWPVPMYGPQLVLTHVPKESRDARLLQNDIL